MLGRGQLGSLVNENFDFEDWNPIASANRRSRDFEPDVAEDRTLTTEAESGHFVDLYGGQQHRESRKRFDVDDKYYYPQDDSLTAGSNSRNEDDALSDESNDLSERPERDCKYRGRSFEAV